MDGSKLIDAIGSEGGTRGDDVDVFFASIYRSTDIGRTQTKGFVPVTGYIQRVVNPITSFTCNRPSLSPYFLRQSLSIYV